jgi:hypothetical protein
MDSEDKVMSDVFITFPNGETLTFGDVWLEVVEGRDYGGRCLAIYMEMFRNEQEQKV